MRARTCSSPGAPGAGKTYVLNEFIRNARAEGASVAVTASTGIASTHINGQTIHSWSGIGVATALTEPLIKLIRSRRRRKIQDTDILVIDEVSMMHAWLFDMVDQVCRIIRRDPRPFGGMQVVLSGDFFQLPPVSVSGRNNDVIAPAPEFVTARERYAKAGRNPEGLRHRIVGLAGTEPDRLLPDRATSPGYRRTAHRADRYPAGQGG